MRSAPRGEAAKSASTDCISDCVGGLAVISSKKRAMGLFAATSTRQPERAISPARRGDAPNGSSTQGAGPAGCSLNLSANHPAATPSGRGGKNRASGLLFAGGRPGRNGTAIVFTGLIDFNTIELHGKIPWVLL